MTFQDDPSRQLAVSSLGIVSLFTWTNCTCPGLNMILSSAAAQLMSPLIRYRWFGYWFTYWSVSISAADFLTRTFFSSLPLPVRSAVCRIAVVVVMLTEQNVNWNKPVCSDWKWSETWVNTDLSEPLVWTATDPRFNKTLLHAEGGVKNRNASGLDLV